MIMKLSYKKLFSAALLVSATVGFSSCDDWLDTPPQNAVTANDYFANADQLGAYAIQNYGGLFGRGGAWNIGSPYLDDNNTDNSIGNSPSQSRYTVDNWKTGNSGSLNTDLIRNCNYFFEQVLPKYEAGKYTANVDLVKHYIGEMYFTRAYTYFARLKTYGDYPIITKVPVNNQEDLLSVGKRMPRNEVADFILQDLDKAIEMLKDKGFANNNRINKQVAQLVKSRVALYEASYERYHKGSGRVPGDAEWPGAKVHPGYTFDVDAHVKDLLGQAMDAAKAVAENITLAQNTGVLDQVDPASPVAGINPYFEMYALQDMSGVDEILMWKAFGEIDGKAMTNGIASFITSGSCYGLMKSYVDNFVMANGLPIYADGSGYHGDETIDKVKEDRDGRLQLFLFGESNWLPLFSTQTEGVKFTPYIGAAHEQQLDVTGYRMRKGENFDKTQHVNGKMIGTQGIFIFRGTEALLNYLEAQYMRDGNLDATSQKYWKAIRNRALVDPDYNKTIAATDMTKEGETDWGAYSHGQLLTDKTLYNIRRERRCEFIGEGMRWDDLVRWCAMDQLKTKKYIPQGVNFWTSMFETATNNGLDDSKVTWIEGPVDEKANVSSREDGKYLCPFRVRGNNPVYDGYTWMEAHYNSPIAIREIELLSPDGSIENSECYQTWGWSTKPNEPALK